MRTTNPLGALFGKSPFGPLQEHMRLVSECADQILPLFEALRDRDHDAVQKKKDRIFHLESRADQVKNELRSHLPRSFFMPVDRRDLLDLLNAQDSIADTAQDIAGIVVLRGMDVPDFLAGGVLPYVERVLDSVHKCGDLIGELDDLLQVGFRGRETDRISVEIEELSTIETETDEMGIALVEELFRHQEELGTLAIVYWDRLIELIGDMADFAEDAGDRLRLLLAR